MTSPASRSVPTLQDPPTLVAPFAVTIVVCTRNRPEQLRNCLEAIGRLNPGPTEVLVVDNTTGNAATRAVAAEFGTRYCIEPVPGLSRARNLGFAESGGDFVAYIDDDSTPDPDWLEHLLTPFVNPAVAAVTGKVQTPDSHPLSTETAARFLDKSNPQWFEIATFGGLGMGSNMVLRKQACGQKIFDERLGRGAPFQIAEENYAFARLLSQGHAVVYVPAAVVCHPPLRRRGIQLEARNSITYALLLFSEFPSQRLALLQFLFRRLRGKPLTWPRDPQRPGEIVSSGWRIKLRAGLEGLWLFLRTKKPRNR